MIWIQKLAAMLLVFSALVSTVFAHTIGVSYAEIEVGDNGEGAADVRWLLRVPLPELDLLLGLDKDHDGDVSPSELDQSAATIRDYLGKHVAVEADRVAVSPKFGELDLWRDEGGHLFVGASMTFAPIRGRAAIRLRCDLVQDVSKSYQTLAKITADGATREFVFENKKSYDVLSPSLMAAIFQFVRMGVFHIFTGYDHIAFLVGLMLIGGSFGSLVKIVTSFTVAHSITLALAALNVVVLPPRLVESGIALSIMYIAAENLFFQKFNRRWIVTFFFGLVHGFGFASALRELNLSRGQLGAALFSFNFGVELGQVCIVGLLLPPLWCVGRTKYRRSVVNSLSAVIFLLGSFWLYQRLRGV